MSTLRRVLSCLTSTVALLFAAPWASAEPSYTDRDLAQSLFDQAKALMADGNYAAACPKLEESQRLDPAGGTLLNLALCHEHQGKIATASTEFKEALSAAKRDEREGRATAAQEHIAALEPQLPWLTVDVTAPVDGEEIRLDDAVLGRVVWGAAFSIDPGVHQLRVTAPGKTPWTSSVTLGLAERRTLSIPALASAAGAQSNPAPAPSSERQAPERAAAEVRGNKQVLAWAIGGAGVVALGVGAYFGIDTLERKHESDKACPTDTTCTPHGVTLNQQAKTEAWLSDLGLVVGVAGIGTSAYLLLSGVAAPSVRRHSDPARLSVNVAATRGGAQGFVRGTW